MSYRSAFRDALERGDLDYLRRMWAQIAPDQPQPSTEAEMHYARTFADNISLRARAWSHKWLGERGLPSGLPDELKPKAERLYPRNVEGVMISVNVKNEYIKPAALEVRGAMEYAVNDIYADNAHPDPALVKREMMAARKKAWKQLLGWR